MKESIRTLNSLLLILQQQQQEQQQVESVKSKLKEQQTLQNKKWHNLIDWHKNKLIQKGISIKKSVITDYLRDRLYSEGIGHKMEKVNNQIDNITMACNKNTRGSIFTLGQGLYDYKKMIVAEKIEKFRQQQAKLLSQIIQLQEQFKIQKSNDI